jgi:hypothetical protein
MSATVIAGVPLAQFAAVTAALAEGFPLRAVLSIEGLDATRWAEADRGWTERLDGDRTLLAQYEADMAAAQSRLLSQDDPAHEDGAAKTSSLRVGKARLVRSGTGDASTGPGTSHPKLAFELPSFVAPLEQLPPPSQLAPPSQAHEPAFAAPGFQPLEDESTQVAFRLPSATLPFVGVLDEPTRNDDAHSAPRHGDVALPFRHEGGPLERPLASSDESTRDAFRMPDALPFAQALAADFPQPAPTRPAIAKGSGSDGATTVIPDLDTMRRLALLDGRQAPFDAKPAPPAPAASNPAPPKAAPPPKPPPLPPRATQASPPPASSQPVMSLERHASLCLEIAVDPARTADALARYQVTAADKARADEHYRARCAADADLHAQWNHAYAVYHAWFTSRSRA